MKKDRIKGWARAVGGAARKKSLPWPFEAEENGANLTLTLKRSERESRAAVCITVQGEGAVNSETRFTNEAQHSP